jgi:hypothetical protein
MKWIASLETIPCINEEAIIEGPRKFFQFLSDIPSQFFTNDTLVLRDERGLTDKFESRKFFIMNYASFFQMIGDQQKRNVTPPLWLNEILDHPHGRRVKFFLDLEISTADLPISSLEFLSVVVDHIVQPMLEIMNEQFGNVLPMTLRDVLFVSGCRDTKHSAHVIFWRLIMDDVRAVHNRCVWMYALMKEANQFIWIKYNLEAVTRDLGSGRDGFHSLRLIYCKKKNDQDHILRHYDPLLRKIDGKISLDLMKKALITYVQPTKTTPFMYLKTIDTDLGSLMNSFSDSTATLSGLSYSSTDTEDNSKFSLSLEGTQQAIKKMKLPSEARAISTPEAFEMTDDLEELYRANIRFYYETMCKGMVYFDGTTDFNNNWRIISTKESMGTVFITITGLPCALAFVRNIIQKELNEEEWDDTEILNGEYHKKDVKSHGYSFTFSKGEMWPHCFHNECAKISHAISSKKSQRLKLPMINVKKKTEFNVLETGWKNTSF